LEELLSSDYILNEFDIHLKISGEKKLCRVWYDDWNEAELENKISPIIVASEIDNKKSLPILERELQQQLMIMNFQGK
jgi:hypothetical protein